MVDDSNLAVILVRVVTMFKLSCCLFFLHFKDILFVTYCSTKAIICLEPSGQGWEQNKFKDLSLIDHLSF